MLRAHVLTALARLSLALAVGLSSTLAGLGSPVSPAAAAAPPTFAAHLDFPTGADSSPQSVAAADLNGDGKPDLVMINYGSAGVSALLNTTAAGVITPTFAAGDYFPTSPARSAE